MPPKFELTQDKSKGAILCLVYLSSMRLLYSDIVESKTRLHEIPFDNSHLKVLEQPIPVDCNFCVDVFSVCSIRFLNQNNINIHSDAWVSKK